MKYKHILFAADLAPNCEQVAKRAHDIATECNATLDVVHVVEHSPIAYGGEFSVPIDINLEQTIETEARKMLNALCAKFSIAENKQHVLIGAVKHSVMMLAKKLNIDLIIVGTHGHHGIDKLLGSRANAILHGATCDVLAVRVNE
jgi:universal stress protein A